MTSQTFDVTVVGAGAAGLMTAIMASRAGLETLLVDGRQKVGAKILMSGGTRCNVTNRTVTENDFETETRHAVRSVLQAYSADQAVEFFKELGVTLLLEPNGKYFPSTNSAQTVLDALLREVERSGVKLRTGCKVTQLAFRDGHFEVSGEGFAFESRSVVLATGGLSFPTTGSDGTGYRLAASMGHTQVPTSASLTPLVTDDADWKGLSGVTLPVELTFWEEGKKQKSFEGSFLFTHFGFSGPVALDISRFWIRSSEAKKRKITANFLPSLTEQKFREMLLAETKRDPAQSIKNLLTAFLPERVADVCLSKLGADPRTELNQISRQNRETLIRSLFNFELRVTGDRGYEKAEVTAGGVPLTEIDKATMQSKLQPGLFFAGEITDVDGRIGGFNFQWAWSSGVVASRGLARYLGTEKKKTLA